MTDRFPRRHRTREIALAAGVLFAAIPMAAAAQPDQTETASAAVLAPYGDSTWRSLVTTSAAAALGAERQHLAAEAARQRARLAETTATSRAATKAGADADAEVEVATAIPTTDVTAEVRRIQALVRKYFPESQLGNAMAVAACESGHSDAIGATNRDGTTDWGVFQLNDGGTLQGSLSAIGVSFDSAKEAQQLALKTEINVRAAASIYADRGWAPWVCAYKIQVVASLYSNDRGPMYGKFDAWGRPTIDVPVVNVDPPKADPAGDGDPGKPEKKEPKGDKRDRDKPDRDPGDDRSTPTPQPTETPEPEPSPTRSPQPGPEPSTSSAPTSRPSAPARTAGPQPSG